MIDGTHLPATDRHLPVRTYGGFDIRWTQDGGQQFSLPHTAWGTVAGIIMRKPAVVGTLSVALICAVVFPADPASPMARLWVYVILVFFPLHALVAFAVSIGVLVSGVRQVTRITIREDGLIWNDQHFFEAEHIREIGYGITSDEGKATESFTPKIEIQVGLQRIVLADDVDPAAGKLFMRLFSEQTRHYWHRHN